VKWLTSSIPTRASWRRLWVDEMCHIYQSNDHFWQLTISYKWKFSIKQCKFCSVFCATILLESDVYLALTVQINFRTVSFPGCWFTLEPSFWIYIVSLFIQYWYCLHVSSAATIIWPGKCCTRWTRFVYAISQHKASCSHHYSISWS
jgi:hypothetical protein